MKRHAYMLTIAFLLMLTMCGAHLKGGLASAPGTMSTAEVLERRPFSGSRSEANLSFGDILSWLAGGLLRTATANGDDAIVDQGSGVQADPVLDRSGDDSGSDRDPYRLRARSQFRTPAHPSAAERVDHQASRGR